MRYLASHAQHIGSRRYQQDSFGFADLEDGEFLEHAGFLSVLCDGMGGMEHGDVASETAVRAMLDAYALKATAESIPQALERSAREANRRVIEAAARLGLREGVGTTLVAAVVHKLSFYFISIGDSAVFHVSNGEARMVNRHHVFANVLDQALASGTISAAEAEQHPEREALTSFIGIRKLDEIDRNLEPWVLKEGDIVLLASDGMFKTLDSTQIAACLQHGSPLSWPQVLVDRAVGLRQPGQDNITVLAIQPHSGVDDPVTPPTGESVTAEPLEAPLQGKTWQKTVLFLALIAIGIAGYWFFSSR